MKDSPNIYKLTICSFYTTKIFTLVIFPNQSKDISKNASCCYRSSRTGTLNNDGVFTITSGIDFENTIRSFQASQRRSCWNFYQLGFQAAFFFLQIPRNFSNIPKYISFGDILFYFIIIFVQKMKILKEFWSRKFLKRFRN